MPAIEYYSHIALPGDPTDDSHAARRRYVTDQVGAKPSLGTGTPTAVAATASAGNATTAAPFNHVHNYSFYATAPAALGTAAIGTANLPARGDHVHAMPSLAQLVSSTHRGIVTGNGTLTSLPLTHNLNSQELDVLVWTNTTPPKRVHTRAIARNRVFTSSLMASKGYISRKNVSVIIILFPYSHRTPRKVLENKGNFMRPPWPATRES